MPNTIEQPQQLTLVKEHKLYKLIRGIDREDQLEASGVVLHDHDFYVVFDNLPRIARIEQRLAVQSGALVGDGYDATGFEDIAYDSHDQLFYMLVEARQRSDDTMQPRVEMFDQSLRHVGGAWLDFIIENKNKGFEGLAVVRRDNQLYLLGLCEGNRCRGGKAGQEPGGGRIQVFQQRDDQWLRIATLQLPTAVQFRDYAGVDIRFGRVAIVSQQSAQLWVGTLSATSWRFVDDGITYEFPRNKQGKVVYCTVEGVTWVDDDSVVVVSDQAKSSDVDERCKEKSESIHLFRLPS